MITLNATQRIQRSKQFRAEAIIIACTETTMKTGFNGQRRSPL